MAIFNYLEKGSVKYGDFIEKTIQFTLKKQLLDSKLWAKFVDVFRTKEDISDLGWRCEFWGKMMRGACLVYQYEPNNELYNVLEKTVIDLLSTQDEFGRFTSYIDEFKGWDMWGRKYIITSLLYFSRICKDHILKEKVIESVKKHADYIIEKIGPNDGQINILTTSNFWGGLNSASITETFVDLYKTTKEKKYLDFAKYVIGTGGCLNGDIVKLAYEGKLSPHEYPVTKAYEMMSFFEGCLEYYTVTNDEYYFIVFKNFIEKVRDNEISVIGCAGCTDELFDNSTKVQTEFRTKYMQETCVTVTWIRILAKYYQITGEKWCIDSIEQAGLNALFGSMNTLDQKGYAWEDNNFVEPLPFDSYSPLVKLRRGIRTGGHKILKDGTRYGCCACIASAGIALFPLNGVLKCGDSLFINYLMPCKISEGNTDIEIEGNYLTDSEIKIKINNIGEFKNIKIRTPSYFENAETSGGIIENNELIIDEIDKIVSIKFKLCLKEIELNDKIFFKYGPLVLGQDNSINGFDPVSISKGTKNIKKVEPEKDEIVRFEIDGVKFANYSSLGKKWNEPSCVSVFCDKK